jgi:hypothetical protein
MAAPVPYKDLMAHYRDNDRVVLPMEKVPAVASLCALVGAALDVDPAAVLSGLVRTAWHTILPWPMRLVPAPCDTADVTVGVCPRGWRGEELDGSIDIAVVTPWGAGLGPLRSLALLLQEALAAIRETHWQLALKGNAASSGEPLSGPPGTSPPRPASAQGWGIDGGASGDPRRAPIVLARCNCSGKAARSSSSGSSESAVTGCPLVQDFCTQSNMWQMWLNRMVQDGDPSFAKMVVVFPDQRCVLIVSVSGHWHRDHWETQ